MGTRSIIPDIEGVDDATFEEQLTEGLTYATPDQMVEIVADACQFFEDKYGDTDQTESIANAVLAINRTVRRLYVLAAGDGSYLIDRRNPATKPVGDH